MGTLTCEAGISLPDWPIKVEPSTQPAPSVTDFSSMSDTLEVALCYVGIEAEPGNGMSLGVHVSFPGGSAHSSLLLLIILLCQNRNMQFKKEKGCI
jgi:hypothetical protein